MIVLSVAHAKGRGASNKKYNLDEYSLSQRMTQSASEVLTKNGIKNKIFDVGSAYPYRTKKINYVNFFVPEPELAVEIHLNSFENERAEYIASFYWHYSKQAKSASQSVCNALKTGYVAHKWQDVRNIPLPCDGFDLDRFWFITNVVYPSILVEPLFLSNDKQAEFLKSENGPESVGELIGEGLTKWKKGVK